MPGFGEALQFMSFSSYPYKATLFIRLKFLLIICSFRNKRLKQQLSGAAELTDQTLLTVLGYSTSLSLSSGTSTKSSP